MSEIASLGGRRVFSFLRVFVGAEVNGFYQPILFLSLVSHRFWLVRIGNDLAHATSSQKRQFAPDDNGIISYTGPAD